MDILILLLSEYEGNRFLEDFTNAVFDLHKRKRKTHWQILLMNASVQNRKEDSSKISSMQVIRTNW